MIEPLYNIFRRNPLISTDSRAVAAGSIFFALRGEKFDGNRYAVSALEQGAVACVVDDAELFAEAGCDERMILVDDVLSALQALARRHRRELGIPILAITGSNGKTTTKELLAAVLSQRFSIYATRGNLNNHIGVPLTLLAMGRDVEFGVVEMGASSCGEIELLCSIAEPNFGIVTNVGRAHLEGFGGVEGVKRGKGELMDYLQSSSGLLFAASQSEVIMEMAIAREGLKRVEYSYSLAEGVAHNLEGEYNRYNVAAAVAVGRYFEVEDSGIRAAVTSYIPTNNRSQRCDTEQNTLILDCYNANPSSMAVALENFERDLCPEREQRVLVLGDMRELGEWSLQEHQELCRRALGGSASRVILVGAELRRAYESLAELGESDARAELFGDCAELRESLGQNPISGAFILIKGSRGVGLEQIVSTL